MKRHKSYLFLAITVFSLFLSGCGTAMYELTPEEEAIIIQSAAHFIAKHNIQQKDGISGLYVTDEMLEPETETQVQPETESESESETVNPQGGGDADSKPPVDTGVSLASAIGHGSDLQIVYTGSVLSKQFAEGSAGSVDAAEGCTFYVMKFNITNVSKETVKVNNITKNLEFRLVNGDMTIKAEKTILSADFSTYLGEIPAGKSVETVILFEVPESKAQGIKDPVLQIVIDKEAKNVKL